MGRPDVLRISAAEAAEIVGRMLVATSLLAGLLADVRESPEAPSTGDEV